MKMQTNILQYFDNIIHSLRQMEKESEVFSELKNISNELEELEIYVKTTLDTLERNFNSFVKQVDLLSELVEFQRTVMSSQGTEKIIHTIFEVLSRNISYDHAFLAFKLKEEDTDDILVCAQSEQQEIYREFVRQPGIEILKSIVKERELAYLITDVQQLSDSDINWGSLAAKSIILFPIKIRGNFHGIGILMREKAAFELNDLSFVNLNIGLISLIVYQHYYFARLKTRLFKQFRLRKMLEEVKYAEYFEKGPLHIFTLDPRSIVLHTNTTAINNLSIDEEHLIGENFKELIPKPYRNSFQKLLSQLEEGEIRFFRSPVLSKKGDERILEFFITPINLQNRFRLILAFAVDVSQNYYMDQVVRRNEMLDEMDQFSRTLIGEFSNLLSTIMPNVSLMRTQLAQDHKLQKHLETMEKGTRRSANLVQKFLNYDLDGFEKSEKGNLNKVIKAFVESFKKEIPVHIEVQYYLDSGLKDTVYFPLRIRQLLKILVDNCVIALEGKKGAQIRFSTRYFRQNKSGLIPGQKFYLEMGNYTEITVKDNGCGIPEKSVSQVLKPFYSTRIKNEGVGLGLFIAYNIVKDLKGEIFIDSEYEEYTTVYIYLPVKEDNSMEVMSVKKEMKEKKVTKRQPTVLVVDDEYNIRSMMREIMEMHGLKVYTAGNGRDGVDVYLRYRDEIDLVVLDMVMPVLDGRAAFEEIRKIDAEQKIFIISGYSQREDLEEMLRKGAVGFLRKPFQVKEIVTKVEEILKSAK